MRRVLLLAGLGSLAWSIDLVAVPISQEAYLKASNTGSTDFFGSAVAISGDTIVVAAPSEASANGDPSNNNALDAGAVYVFVRSGTTWTQQAYLKAGNPEAGDKFGSSVAISGDTIVVGAYGEDSAANGVNGDETDNSASGAGAAYVFVRSGTTWTRQAYLKASNTGTGDEFGTSVSISGDTIVVGAPDEDSNATGVNAALSPGSGTQADNSKLDSGAAYVFVRNGTTWSQQAYLKASNTHAGDIFGYSTAISGDTIVVGAQLESSNATGVGGDQSNTTKPGSGAAYVFVRSGTTWSQQAYIKASNTDSNDLFGTSVALSGDTLVAGAPGEASNATGVGGDQTDNSRMVAGAAYVFIRSGSQWSQQAYVKASNTGASDQFGTSISVSSDSILVGAFAEGSNARGLNGDGLNDMAPNSGAAYLFSRSGITWSQQSYLKSSNSDPGDGFGTAVAISGGTMVVGAIDEDSLATGVGGNQANNSFLGAGAAYVFVIDSDGDGTSDDLDGCPNDLAKTQPGQCGCGAADTDTDGDGIADCVDGCPDDPAKTAPGACGCGVADADANGNGVADCIDATNPTSSCGTCGPTASAMAFSLVGLFVMSRARQQRGRAANR
jgi:hypothetical protein